jgi:hypothetical protein
MIFTLHTAVALVAPWAHLYNDHSNVSAGVAFLHLGGLLAAGGFAIAADRGTLRAFAGDAAARRSHVAELGAVHRPVLLALTVVMASGVLMLAADLESLITSPVFWVKMALVAALLANGLGLTRAGQRLEREPDSETDWLKLRRWSLSSLALWFAVTLVGTFLTNAA